MVAPIKEVERRTSFFFQGMPVAVKDRFKAYCARRGVTMKAKLLELMKSCIKEDEVTDDNINSKFARRTQR